MDIKENIEESEARKEYLLKKVEKRALTEEEALELIEILKNDEKIQELDERIRFLINTGIFVSSDLSANLLKNIIEKTGKDFYNKIFLFQEKILSDIWLLKSIEQKKINNVYVLTVDLKGIGLKRYLLEHIQKIVNDSEVYSIIFEKVKDTINLQKKEHSNSLQYRFFLNENKNLCCVDLLNAINVEDVNFDLSEKDVDAIDVCIKAKKFAMSGSTMCFVDFLPILCFNKNGMWHLFVRALYITLHCSVSLLYYYTYSDKMEFISLEALHESEVNGYKTEDNKKTETRKEYLLKKFKKNETLTEEERKELINLLAEDNELSEVERNKILTKLIHIGFGCSAQNENSI